MTYAMTVEGVLRKPVGGQPIREGLELYYGLVTRGKLILLTDELTHDELDHWLRIEGLREHSRVIWNSAMYGQGPGTAGIRRVCQLNEARRQGHAAELVVEPDPAVAAELIYNGYSTLLFTHANYAVPSWRPDYQPSPTPWSKLSAMIDDNALTRAEDKRLPDGD